MSEIKLTEKDLINKGLLVGGEYLADQEHEMIEVSPNFDLGSGGGLLEGSFVNFSGPEKACKTTLALHIAAKAQKQKRPTLLVDVEHRIKKMHLRGIKGLKLAEKPGDTSGLQIMRSTEGHILTAEEFLTGTGNFIKDHPRAIVILDSTSALCSAKELTSSITGTGRALGPRMLAEFCRANAAVVPINKTLLISIQHLIANTSGFGSPFMEDSGRKLQYQSDYKLRCKRAESITVGENEIGKLTTWQVLWSANGPPGAKIKTYVRYGVGVDELQELIELGLDFGLISKAGAWMDCPFLHVSDHEYVKDFVGDKEPAKAFKCQGRENLYQFLDEHPIFQEILHKQIKAIT